MKNKREFKKPQYYWKIAEKYILLQREALKSSEFFLDEKIAMKCIRIASFLKHTSGEFAGINFQFQEWQVHSIIDIFGTKHKKTNLRRYQRVLFFMPKKNGKSEFAGLLHAIMFFVDSENAKEQYSIATESEQAKIIHKVFLTMIKQEPDLYAIVKSTVKPPRITKENNVFTDEFQSLTSSADTKDGLRPSFLTVDEGHAHTSKDLYQIMTDGLAGRNEPLEIHLSTAGYNKEGFFYRDIYQYAKKVKQGIIKDDAFYSVMFEPDEEDLKDANYWKNPKIWAKVNPNLGISPTYSYMEGKIATAENSEESLVAFKTKHLNVWCDQATTWISTEKWNNSFKYDIKLSDMKGRECYGGLDLSSTTDITALVYVFPKENDEYDVLCRFWIPLDNMRERERRDKVPYSQWVRDGYITATDGNVIDYAFIEKQIKDDCELFDVKEIAYDRWNSSALITRLEDEGVSQMIPFGQGFASMSTPTKQIETLVLQQKLNHGNNPVLTWMMSNVALRRDPADNFKIDKAKSSEKVDGIVSLAMAIGVKLISKKEDEKTNPYLTRGLRSL